MAAAKPEIRDYDPADRPALIALARELQRHEAALFDRMKAEEEIGDGYLDALLAECRAHRGHILVAAKGGGLLGYAAILTEVWAREALDEVDYTYALVQDLAVTEAARGRGIGAALLAHCEQIARAAGARWLRINVLAANSGAARLYARAGLRPLLTTMEKPLVE